MPGILLTLLKFAKFAYKLPPDTGVFFAAPFWPFPEFEDDRSKPKFCAGLLLSFKL